MRLPIAYVAVVHKSHRVLSKLSHRKGIIASDVDEAVCPTAVETSWWVHDEERGWRLKVVGRTAAGRQLLVVLSLSMKLTGCGI